MLSWDSIFYFLFYIIIMKTDYYHVQNVIPLNHQSDK